MPQYPQQVIGSNPFILASCLAPAGCEKQTYLVARALKERGMSPAVIVWSLTSEDFYRKHIEEIGVPIAVAPQGQGRWAKLRWIRSLVQRAHPAILHSMAFFLNSAAAWATVFSPTIAIGAIRSDYSFEARYGPLHYAVNRRWPETVIANSDRAWRAAIADQSVFRPRQPLVVHNAIDLAQYSPRVAATRPGLQIIGVGNLFPEKRWDRLIYSVSGLVASRPELAFTVKIAGEGKQREELERLVCRLGLERRVMFLGRRLDIPELLVESDIFVMASDSEGTPNAIMEAMAAGLPVVATNVGDVRRLVAEGVNGFVVNCNQEAEHSMTCALFRLLTDPLLRSHMGAAGRTRAESEFSLSHLADQVLSAYDKAGWKQQRIGAKLTCF